MTHASPSQSSANPIGSLSATTVLSPLALEILEGRNLDPELLSRLGWRSSSKNIGGETIELDISKNNGYKPNYEINRTKTFRKDSIGGWLLDVDGLTRWKGLWSVKHGRENEKGSPDFLRAFCRAACARNGSGSFVHQSEMRKPETFGTSDAERKCTPWDGWSSHEREVQGNNSLSGGASL